MGKVDALIAEVHKRPELWSSKHPLYKNRAVKTNVLTEISKKLNVNHDIVKRRWKNLKDQYRKEVKRLTQTDQPSPWQYFESLDFLRDEVTKVSTWDAPKSEDEGTSEDAPPPQKKRLADSMREEIIQLEQKKLSLVEKQLAEQESLKDEDYLYMMSVLPYMRRLNLTQKLRFRGKINQWLLDTVTCTENRDGTI